MSISVSISLSFHCSQEHCFVNSSNNRTWLRFNCLSTPAYVLTSPHCLQDCEKLSMPEVFQRTPQDPEKATSNHRLSRQPHFSVKPQEVRWLRPGQWPERSATPSSCSRLKKTLKCKVSLSAQRQVCMAEESWGTSERIWHLLFLLFLPTFLNGIGQSWVLKPQKWEALVTLVKKRNWINLNEALKKTFKKVQCLRQLMLHFVRSNTALNILWSYKK